MRKYNELTNPSSCIAKAFGQEMIFVLLGRDEAAPHAIREWVKERIRIGKNIEGDEQTRDALLTAIIMDDERSTFKPKRASNV